MRTDWLLGTAGDRLVQVTVDEPLAAPGGETSLVRARRCYAVFTGAAYLAFGLLLSPVIAGQAARAAGWWTPSAVAAVFLPGLALGAAGAVTSDPVVLRRLSGATVCGLIVAAALWPFAWTGGGLPAEAVFWPAPIVVLTGNAALLVWSETVATGYLIVAALTVPVLGGLAPPQASTASIVAAAAWTLAFCLVPFAVQFAGLRTARTADAAIGVAIDAAREVATEHARLRERRRVRALAHDQLIATLRAAATGELSPPGVRRAQAALTALDEAVEEVAAASSDPPAYAGQIADQVAAAVRSEDPGVAVHARLRTGSRAAFSPVALVAIREAAAEAARNCVRHLPAGTPREVQTTITDHRIEVRISDRGPGFRREDVSPERLGLIGAIEGRMRAVPGGYAAVRSDLGRGTVVTVGWVRRAGPAMPLDGADVAGLRSRGAAVVAATASCLVAVAALAGAGELHRPWVLAPLLLLGASAAAAVVDRRAGPLRPGLVAWVAFAPAAMLACLLAGGLAPGAALPQWIAGVPASLLGVLALRGNAVAAVAGFLGTLLVAVTWMLTDASAQPAGLVLLLVYGGFLVVGVVFSGITRSVAASMTVLAERVTAASCLAAAWRAAHDERVLRSAPLAGIARPLLVALASGDPVTDDLRVRCALAEGRLRDLLRAPGLCVPEVDAAVGAARSRGVGVVLLDDLGGSDVENDDPPPIDGRTSAAIAAVLAAAESGTVQVRRLPAGRSRALTVVVDAPGVHYRLEIDHDGRRTVVGPDPGVVGGSTEL